jgi:hypothetical protein
MLTDREGHNRTRDTRFNENADAPGLARPRKKLNFVDQRPGGRR